MPDMKREIKPTQGNLPVACPTNVTQELDE